MVVTSAAEARALDAKAMKEYGLPEAVLMENAGAAVVRLAGEELAWRGAEVVILCGDGNNGGDGFVAARYAAAEGAHVTVLFIGKASRMSDSSRLYRQIAEKANIFIKEIQEAAEAAPWLLGADIIVDALIGTGLTSDVRGEKFHLIHLVNQTKARVVAVDVPSGLDSDTGKALGTVVEADITVALGSVKRGHVLSPGQEHCGKLKVSPIGMPETLHDEWPVHLMTAREAAELIPRRLRTDHKGRNGNIGIFAGSSGMEGAALLAAQGALYAGGGKISLLTAGPVAGVLAGKVPEVMVRSVCAGPCFTNDETVMAMVKGSAFTVTAVGCGLGRNEQAQAFTEAFLSEVTQPVVVDADALYAVAAGKIPLKDCAAPVVITPHVGEFSFLTGFSPLEIEARRFDCAIEYARENHVVVVLKGAPTVTALPDGRAWVNTTGNPGMASGGMGDTLTGIIAALIGQGMRPGDAAAVGVYLHGLAGDLAAEKTPVGFCASDLARLLPEARTRVMKYALREVGKW